ncbi:AlpA family transcriptional regulator [Salmonella enterica]|nr:AlpA family transcriptional regulator [Salmonella enterica]EAW3345751.1 AlpA family transcriptional regulator [Salmonella enterica]EBD6954654.1 AlpA family transcriptional regulator [Salmonella enterica]ECK6591650.1 AlpA family transcriptional regulator [Salmonella enterica]ECR7631883.1 AlpA family transcriptional regulator [Salmonella enterica]
MKHSLIRLPEVCRRTGNGKSWTYKQIKEGRFPQPVKTGFRSVAWVESEVDAWIEQRIAERDTGYAGGANA